MITYDFFENGRLLIEKFPGTLDKSYLRSYMEFISLKLPDSIELVLADFRKTELNLGVNDLLPLIALQEDMTKGIKHKIINVHLVDTPKETALSTLFSLNFPNSNNLIHICSTINTALILLGLKLTEQEIEDTLQNLAFQFKRPDY